MATLRKIKVNDELTYEVPAPAPHTDILFKDRKRLEQHWPTNERALYAALELPDQFFDWNENTLVNQENTIYDDTTGQLTHLSVDDTGNLVEIRDRELRRRQEGIYFMNKGEIEFITGPHYFFLTHYIIPATGHPRFYKYQRDVFYVLDIVMRTGCRVLATGFLLTAANIIGVFFIKAKKTGLTHIIACLFLNEATMIRDRAFGIMNKTQDDANDLNIVFFWRAYEELPPIMQPRFSHKNLSKIIFGTPVVKFTGTKLSVQKGIDAKRNRPLNTWVYSAPTKLEPKFDGPLMYMIHLDEFPKWKLSQQKFFGKVTETVKIQQTINGKIFITSYPPEEDGAGFEEAKEIYYDGKLSTIKDDGLGRTASGMICHCIGALEATDGTIDIYGDADTAKALALNEAERRQCKNATELQEKIRQYGRNEEEMWRSGGSGSTYDNGHLALALENLDKRERAGEILQVEGNLDWENGNYSRVLFTPVTPAEQKAGVKAWWKFYERYATVHLNKVVRDSDGFYHPLADTLFVASSDPTEYKIKTEIKRDPSDWSITVMSFPDTARNTMMQRTASKVEVADYLDRHDDPDDDLDELIKCVFYFGCYVLIEANKQWVVTQFRKLGLHKFLLLRQKDGSILPYEEGQLNMAVTSTEDVIEEYCRLTRTYLRWPQNSDEIDYCLLLRNRAKIRRLMRFNPKRTKEFDDIVNFGLLQIAMAAFSVLRQRLKDQEKKDKYLDKVFEAITGFV